MAPDNYPPGVTEHDISRRDNGDSVRPPPPLMDEVEERESVRTSRKKMEDFLYWLKSFKTEMNEHIDDKINEVVKWLRK